MPTGLWLKHLAAHQDSWAPPHPPTLPLRPGQAVASPWGLCRDQPPGPSCSDNWQCVRRPSCSWCPLPGCCAVSPGEEGLRLKHPAAPWGGAGPGSPLHPLGARATSCSVAPYGACWAALSVSYCFLSPGPSCLPALLPSPHCQLPEVAVAASAPGQLSQAGIC